MLVVKKVESIFPPLPLYVAAQELDSSQQIAATLLTNVIDPFDLFQYLHLENQILDN